MAIVTQFDIARRLGLSRSTVKAALTPHPRVQLSPATRNRILETARKLGYRANKHAQAMRTGKTGAIGMIHCSAPVQFAGQRSMQVARAIAAQGYQPLASDLLWYPKNMDAACNTMLDARVEGVVLVSPTHMFPKQEVFRLQRAGIPVVAVAGVRLPRVPHVRADVRAGMRDLTRHLLKLGRRRLVLLAQDSMPHLAPEQIWPLTERVAGFRAALKAEGAAIRESSWVEGLVRSEARLFEDKKGRRGPAGRVILYTPSEERAAGCEHGFVAMRQLLKTRGDADAILCTNDDWAMGALAACGEAGVRVPQDLAITGFDDMLYARYGAVPLTTMAQPLERMTQHAVALLARMIRGAKPAAREMGVKMPCRLVVRRSCGAGPV